MTDPRHSADEPSPFVGQMAWPPSAVARKPGMLLPVMGGIGIALLGLIVYGSLSTHRPAGGGQAGAPAAMPPAAMAPARPFAQSLGSGEAAVQAPVGGAAMPGLAGTVRMPVAPGETMAPAAAASRGDGAFVGAPLDQGAGGPGQGRYHAPLLVVDGGGRGSAGVIGAASLLGGGNGGAASPAPSRPAGEGSLAAQLTGSPVESVSPTRMGDTAHIAPQGTIIPAVLETAINSDLPGFVRAIVSRNVCGYDGTTVLIPRGSRLIGQYRNALAVGQSRAFVVWTRLITPAGLSLDIQSPGVDNQGRGGLAGETHSHFFRRFGNAILLSVLNAGLQAGANAVGNPSTAIIIGSQAQAANVATMALQKEIDIPVTVTVNQGTPIQVFVARDIDFTGVLGKR